MTNFVHIFHVKMNSMITTSNIIQSYNAPCFKEFSMLFYCTSVYIKVSAVASTAAVGSGSGNDDNGNGTANKC